MLYAILTIPATLFSTCPRRNLHYALGGKASGSEVVPLSLLYIENALIKTSRRKREDGRQVIVLAT